jgi:hypothetical protein
MVVLAEEITGVLGFAFTVTAIAFELELTHPN